MMAWRHPGVLAALAAAALFGASAPIAKVLLGQLDPWLLAGLLYLGSGLGLGSYRLVRRTMGSLPPVDLARADVLPLAGAVVIGGMVAPVLLLAGLSALPASGASLLLNAEGVLTALVAWVVFGENANRRVVAGMVAIALGAILLTVPLGAGVQFGRWWPSLAILAACLCWAVDNNLTRMVSLTDASFLAGVKGLVAGSVNLVLALLLGSRLPAWPVIGSAMGVGLVAYGISLMLFVVALRLLGAARSGAYFSTAPFFGAVLALAMGEALTWPLVAAAALMGIGVWLHLTEVHEHEHTHYELAHNHWHLHDDHHQHDHRRRYPFGHRHTHRHTAVTHTHPHFPDMHHRH